MPLPNDFICRIRVPAFLLVAFLSIGSGIEVLVSSWPLHVHDVNWRLGVLNSVAAATGTELLALFILIVMAQLLSSRSALWTSFCFSIFIAASYAIVAGMFALDSLEVRGRVAPAQLSRFDVTIVWALVRFAIAELASLWLAASALAAARALRREFARDSANRLVVGVASSEASPVVR